MGSTTALHLAYVAQRGEHNHRIADQAAVGQSDEAAAQMRQRVKGELGQISYLDALGV